MHSVYVSKHNSNREKEVIPLMISNGERWHYAAVKKVPALLRGITSKYHGDFHFRNCFHSSETKNKLESYKKGCGNKDFCNVVMPSENTGMLEFHQYWQSDKASFIIR